MGDNGESTGTGESLRVVPDDVRAIGRYAYQQAQALRSALESAGREVEHLTSCGWLGDAGGSFARGWSECRNSGTEIIGTLADLAAKLGVTADTYQKQDARSGATFTNLIR